jgi:uncharacterized membrane protein YfcA
MEPNIILIGIAISMFSGLLGQLAGGGGGLITIPFLIFFGVPPHVAIGSNKVAAFGNIGALHTYIKNKQLQWNWIPILTTIGLVAGWFGATLTLNTDPELIEKIIAILIFALLPFILFKKSWGTTKKEISKTHKGFGLFFYSIAAVVQAAYSAGLGIINTYILVTFFGWTLIEANATRRIPLIIMNILVFGIFLKAGAVNISLALGIFIGQLVGGYIGSHIVIRKGNEFVKTFFIILVVISAIELLF